MAQVIVTESSLQNIGTAIRSKLGTQDTYKPSEMAGAISQIHGDPVLETLTANANDTYNPSSGKDGFSQVVVNVPNSYASGDEGKVVSNGALVAQSSQSISANGTYDTTLKNQVNVSVPNSYSASDEGKVVNNGALVAQSSQTITENGTYNTTLKNQIVVNVSGGGGGNITQGTTAPTSDMGSNGDYYYKGQYKTDALGYLGNVTSATGQTKAGWEFKANTNINIIGLTGYVSSSNTGSLVLADSSGNILGQIDDVQFSANTLTEAYFDAPIALSSDTNYIVQIWARGLLYAQGVSAFDNRITFVRGRYGGLPGNQESNTLYSANIIIEGDGLFRVEEEYYKSNGSWIQL